MKIKLVNTPLTLSAIILTAGVLAACSDKTPEKAATTDTESSQPASTTPAAGSSMPSGHPDMNSPEMQTRMQEGMKRMQQMNQGTNPPQVIGAGEGKVLKVMHSAGYTYMEVDMGDKTTWVAATTIKIKSGDTVKWQGASIMKNFSSKSLHRTFDEILFVSNASKG